MRISDWSSDVCSSDLVVGQTGNPGQVNYAASKAGLVGMSKALAQELASRTTTVNCVAPRFLRSAMTDVLPEARKESLRGRFPQGDLGTAAGDGAAVGHLASKGAGSRHTTGEHAV